MQTLSWPSPTPTPDFPPCRGEPLSVVSELPDASTLSCPSLPETWLSSATSWVQSARALSPHRFQAWNGDRSALCPHCSSKCPLFLPQSTPLPWRSTLSPPSLSPQPSPNLMVTFSLRWACQSLAPYFSLYPDSCHHLWWLEHPHRQFWWHHSLWAPTHLLSDAAFSTCKHLLTTERQWIHFRRSHLSSEL